MDSVYEFPIITTAFTCAQTNTCDPKPNRVYTLAINMRTSVQIIELYYSMSCQTIWPSSLKAALTDTSTAQWPSSLSEFASHRHDCGAPRQKSAIVCLRGDAEPPIQLNATLVDPSTWLTPNVELVHYRLPHISSIKAAGRFCRTSLPPS